MNQIKPYFSNIRQEILSCLDLAEKQIKVAVYWFTNHLLFDKLCEKLNEGKAVELIIHNDVINNRKNGLDFQKFIDLGGKFYFSDGQNPMHNKFCLIDSSILINGSYNWTYNAENKNRENILIIQNDQRIISAFDEEFENLKNKLTPLTYVERLSIYEIDDFNSLNSREYLANEIIYQAKATNRPELVKEAFEVAPSNVRIQQMATTLDLVKRKKLNNTIGASLKDDKYLPLFQKGTLVPTSSTEIVQTVKDNQASVSATIYYGENEQASQNSPIGYMYVQDLPPKPAGQAKLKYICSITLEGRLILTKYSLDNGSKNTLNIDINKLLVEA